MSYYVVSIIFAFYSFFIYALFRGGVDDFLRYNKNGKNFIRKNKKGFFNFWFYRQLHSKTHMSILYHFNCVTLLLTALYFFSVILFGWIFYLRIPLTALSIFLCILHIPATLFMFRYNNLRQYGKSFILFRYNKYYKRADTSLIDFGLSLISIAFVSFIIFLIKS